MVLGGTNEGTHMTEANNANERSMRTEFSTASGLSVLKRPVTGTAKKYMAALSIIIETYDILTSFLV